MTIQDTQRNAECWFLDVGQGTANIILLGNSRAIVVDSGTRSPDNVPLKLLKKHVNKIEALIVSHNDADHDGGVARILEAFPRAVEHIYYLSDRPAKNIRTYCVVKQAKEAGNLLRDPERIEAGDKPQIIYSDRDRGLELAVIYPTFLETQQAEESGSRRPNMTSAILYLRCGGGHNIIFSGDATIEAWDALASRLSDQTPLPCDIVTVPHHGGQISQRMSGESRDSFEARHSEDIQRLYSQVLNPSRAIVSVGSSNQFSHPLPSTIHTLRQLGVKVLCTQMTSRCCNDLESVRPGVITPRWPSQSCQEKRFTNAGRSKDVGCAGTIVAEIGPDTIAIPVLSEYSEELKAAVSSQRVDALCLD